MTGVLLLNLGGPDSLDAVRPFLYNLFSDREIIRLGPAFIQKPLASFIAATRAGKTQSMYRRIGGKSPILDITKAQAAALEETLNSGPATSGKPYRVYIGMRYWRPFIEDAV
ncbi:MAG TPA: ferrochelatase, partial [Dissulfurispiraceae bacterium]|nr:ferrochelatase [Dissulfurispiraceae bacterium]